MCQLSSRRFAFVLFGVAMALRAGWAQQTLSLPHRIDFSATADSLTLPRAQSVGLVASDNSAVQFRFDRVTTDGGPNFVVISPSAGSTPATVEIALNPNVVPFLPSGTYALLLGFSALPPSTAVGGTQVFLKLSAPPAPVISSLVNAATLQPGISPGAIVSIRGTNLGTQPVSTQYDAAGLYPTVSRIYSGTDKDGVTFNGIPAPLLYMSNGQINAQVPYGVAGQQTVDVVVTHNLQSSAPFTTPILDTSPGIFAANQNGTGQAMALNRDGTVNGSDNPAPKLSAITLYATGAGLMNRTDRPLNVLKVTPVQDGSIVIGRPPLEPMTGPTAKVSISIGGQPAAILYAGGAPFTINGVLLVQVFVPDGIGSGPQPIILTVGEHSSAPQQVSIYVK